MTINVPTIADLISFIFLVYFTSILINTKQRRIGLKAVYNIENEISLALKENDPCERLSKNLAIIFDQHERADFLFKIDNATNCFKRGDFFSQVYDFADKSQDEEIIETFLIPMAKSHHPDLIQSIFYKCCQRKYYTSVSSLLRSDVYINSDGKNILHLAAEFDDLYLAARVKFNKAQLLHLRDSSGRLSFNYVKSSQILNVFKLRLSKEENKSPFRKEIEVYLKRASRRVKLPGTIVPQYKLYIEDGKLVEISRQAILKDSFEAAQKAAEHGWFRPEFGFKFCIKFRNEIAVDASGVTNEWMSLLLESFFNPNPHGNAKDFTAPLFKLIDDESTIYVPTNLYPEIVYRFAGEVIALAMRRGIPLRAKIIPSFYRILFRLSAVRFDDLEIVSPQIYKNLLLLNHNGAEAETARDLLDLKLGNAQKYVDGVAVGILYKRYKDSLQALAQGFSNNFRGCLNEQFDPYELKERLEGVELLTFSQISDNFLFYGMDSKVKTMFLNVMSRMSSKDLLLFLKFVTGRNGLPVGGLSALGINIIVRYVNNCRGRLPKSSTCFNRLTLHRFDSENELEKSLIFAIQNCETLDNI